MQNVNPRRSGTISSNSRPFHVDLTHSVPGLTTQMRSRQPPSKWIWPNSPIPQNKQLNDTGSRPGRTYLVLLVLHELVYEVGADEARPTSDEDPQVSLDQTAIWHQ